MQDFPAGSEGTVELFVERGGRLEVHLTVEVRRASRRLPLFCGWGLGLAGLGWAGIWWLGCWDCLNYWLNDNIRRASVWDGHGGVQARGEGGKAGREGGKGSDRVGVACLRWAATGAHGHNGQPGGAPARLGDPTGAGRGAACLLP